jgi:hypothetical protein
MTKVRDDPYVHFGDVVQLLHVNTGCLLAVDVEDKVREAAAAVRTGQGELLQCRMPQHAVDLCIMPQLPVS